MEIDLPKLRAEWLQNPLISRVLTACAMSPRKNMTTLDWCRKSLDLERGMSGFNEALLAFRSFENAGCGRILQPSQQARARFQWALSPLVLETALRNDGILLTDADLLPVAAKMGIRVPADKSARQERPGWTRHILTLRPDEPAEVLMPDDLTAREAEWLAGFFAMMADRRKKSGRVDGEGSKVAN